jgi:hypothetical protein
VGRYQGQRLGGVALTLAPAKASTCPSQPEAYFFDSVEGLSPVRIR